MTLPDLPALIVFDVDGTLVDSQAQILGSMEAAFAALGSPMPPRAEALSVVGLSLSLALAALAPGATPVQVAAMEGAYRARFQELRLAGQLVAPLFPGTREMLAMLSGAGARLGLATGKSRRGLDHLLELHDLTGFFDTVQAADDHPSKPDPSMLLAALRDTGAAAAAAVMVGDTAFDMEMGRAAGFRTIAVTWGYHGRERLTAADALIDSWRGLVPALAGMERAA